MHPEVLLIDDDSIFMMFFKRMIIKSGIAVEPKIFRNGLEAYQFIKENCENGNQFLLFVDINMPVMNGWQFLEKITEECNLKNITAYMVSSSTNESDIAKSKNYACVKDFLIKPVMQDTLEAIRNAPEIAAYYS